MAKNPHNPNISVNIGPFTSFLVSCIRKACPQIPAPLEVLSIQRDRSVWMREYPGTLRMMVFLLEI